MAREPVSLSQATLTHHAEQVPVPTYDRTAVTCGIVHIGVGGFHRAHQAMYVDRLLEQGLGDGWGICGVGVLPSDVAMRDAMQSQDCLYTLALKHPDGTWETRVVGSILRYLFAPDDPDAVVEQLASPDTRIVSLTVTEGGYNMTGTAEFDAGDADVVHDLGEPGEPRTVFGLVIEALRRRRERGLPSFTVMSCDNIAENGHVARRMFTAFARLRDPGLAAWIEAETAFPCSMVDRITPVTTRAAVEEIAARFGIADVWPVVAEPFTTWALEDTFTLGRPPYEDAGVTVVDDVAPYEMMKLRLLNASHQGIAYFGYLAGYRLVHEACQDPLVSQFLLDYMNLEATPTLRPVPGVDLDTYKHTLIERFSNPQIADTVARLCAESSDRIPKWLVPVIRDQLAAGGPVDRSAAIVASWARYAEGVDEVGDPIKVVDRLADSLVPIARSQRDEPSAFVANRSVFGDLADQERFMRGYLWALESLHTSGARATLEALREPGPGA